MDKQKHNSLVVEQFSQQAAAYSAVKAHSEALDTVLEMSEVSSEDNVIDIACGSGIVSCAFARYAKHVTGIDITARMLQQAQTLQTQNGLANMDWVQDDVVPLRFNDKTFSIVVTRFSFHHFIDYEKVFDEMIRVCKPDGKIMVIDVALPKEKLEAYDAMERLRDNSHVAALSIDQFDNLFFHNKNLYDCQKAHYEMMIDMDTQINASFLSQEDKTLLRQMIVNDVHRDSLGIQVKEIDGKYELRYPIYIYVARKRR